jgi:quercetin dioxygenase-like cupin family protein
VFQLDGARTRMEEDEAMTHTLPVLRQEDNVDEVTWDDARGRLSFRSLIDGDETATSALTFGITTVAPGGFLSPHRHAPPEIYYVIAGTGVVTIDGKRYDVSPGSSLFIPGNAEHGIANEGSETLKLLYAFAVDRFSDVTYVFS